MTCYLRREGRIEILGDNYCPNAKPPAEQDCFLRPCEGVDWVTSPWSGVSVAHLEAHFFSECSCPHPLP